MVAEGITVVVSTSYLDEAERCDRVVLLNHGRVLALDQPQALQASLAGTMVRVRADDPRAARDVLRATEAIRSAALFGDAVHVLLEDDVAKVAVTAPLIAAGVSVLDVVEIEPSLEDIFIHLVGATDG